MSKYIYDATITYDTTDSHCDARGAALKDQVFSDTYYFNTNIYNDYDYIKRYIKHDLKLVAGGGYDYDNIKNIRFSIEFKGIKND